MNKKIVLFSVVVAGVLALVVPLPFKPSLWGLLKHRQLSAQLDKSADPVYLAKANGLEPVFTTYSNWVNAYDIISPVRYYQLSERSSIGVDSESPDQAEVEFLGKIQSGVECAKTQTVVSFCAMSKTGRSAQRQFAAAHRGEYILVTELTTIAYKDGIGEDGYLNYRPLTDGETKQSLEAISSALPLALKEAKKRYFKPIY